MVRRNYGDKKWIGWPGESCDGAHGSTSGTVHVHVLLIYPDRKHLYFTVCGAAFTLYNSVRPYVAVVEAIGGLGH